MTLTTFLILVGVVFLGIRAATTAERVRLVGAFMLGSIAALWVLAS